MPYKCKGAKAHGTVAYLDCGHEFWQWGARLTAGDTVWCTTCKQPSQVPERPKAAENPKENTMTENTVHVVFTTGPGPVTLPVLVADKGGIHPHGFAYECAKSAAKYLASVGNPTQVGITEDNADALAYAAEQFLRVLGVTGLVDEDGDPLPTREQKMHEGQMREDIKRADLTPKQRRALAAAFAVDPKDLA